MADGLQGEREATFKLIEEVHDCSAVWDVSPGAYKDTKNKEKLKVVAKGGISTDIGFQPNLSVSSLALHLKKDQDTSGTST